MNILLGIIGVINGKVIEDCINYGLIEGNNYTGGITNSFGSNDEIKNCTNFGTIKGISTVGGIAGTIRGSAENCTNKGNVIANNNYAGGLSGIAYGANISNCSNTGDIEAKCEEAAGTAGGIVGYYSTSSDENSICGVYNSGKVTVINKDEYESESVGGIIGYKHGEIENTLTYAYNKGEVEGGEYIGAIIGKNMTNNPMSNCYYYLPDGSNLQAVGHSKEGTVADGAVGSKNYNYSSLQEFLNAVE